VLVVVGLGEEISETLPEAEEIADIFLACLSADAGDVDGGRHGCRICNV